MATLGDMKITLQANTEETDHLINQYCTEHHINRSKLDEYVLARLEAYARFSLAEYTYQQSTYHRGTYADPEYPAPPMMPPCHPSRPAITGTWETVIAYPTEAQPGTLQTGGYEWEAPQQHPEPIEDDNVFSPRPAYVPVKDC